MATNPGFLAAQEFVGRQLTAAQLGPPAGPTFGAPAHLPTGICARSVSQAQDPTTRAIIDSVVVDTVSWAQLQPTVGGALNSGALSTLLTDLDWVAANNGTRGQPMKAILRPGTGFQAPAAVKTAIGALPWATNHGVDPSWTVTPDNPSYSFLPGGVPIWWDSTFWSYYADFHAKLAASAVGSHPAVALITMALPVTEFNEPCLRQFGYDGNKTAAWTNATAAGPWTVDKDSASFAAGWAAHVAAWAPHGIACETAFNPAQEIFLKAGGPALGYRESVARTRQLEQTMTALLGRLSMWANYSVVNPQGYRGANYDSMYQGQIDARAQSAPFPQAIGYQSETLVKFQADNASNPATTVPNALDMVVGWGATRFELPRGSEKASSGVHYISPTHAAAANLAMYANSLPLTA